MDKSFQTLKKQYIAAMTVEMKCPLEKIIDLTSGDEHSVAQKSEEIKDAARYLLSLVDELSSLAGPLENVTEKPDFGSHFS